eukprot:TRINITY_DN12463_c0_g1_i1.p1 TRINITY_DN12463_c0_g1~~TRINITY_DN12463_c0_g1_i1.p1  ORF type:complete len:837 (-),score=109.86 TRINITY_DN12463_c0_g1_i1:126-2636(-)
MDVLWLRRDVRIRDNEALTRAAERAGQAGGSLCILFVFDERWVKGPHCHASHCQFVAEGLEDLAAALSAKSSHAGVFCRHGYTEQALQALHEEGGVARLWSHRVIGDAEQRAIDEAVQQWCEQHKVEWQQLDQYGLVQGGRLQSGKSVFAKHFEAAMQSELAEDVTLLDVAIARAPAGWHLNEFPRHGHASWQQMGVVGDLRPLAPKGGEGQARQCLSSFLQKRGEHYAKGLSAPGTAWTACSRLSAYLAWGQISLRSVVHATKTRRAELKAQGATAPTEEVEELPEDISDDNREAMPVASTAKSSWGQSLWAFQSRLHWRSHFMQKLADDAELDVRNMCAGYDGMRCEKQSDMDEEEQAKLQCWLSGQTGYPLVDACMRALHKSGWINFRMRCMLVSFAAYDLWLSWKVFGPALAQLFIDYEPGIHYPQIQMQSGTTGINSNRIYDPNKQVLDHDAEGVFIKQYVLELKDADCKLFSKPQKLSIPSYPKPVVNHAIAIRAARPKLNEYNRIVKHDTQESRTVFTKHGSRRTSGTSSTSHAAALILPPGPAEGGVNSLAEHERGGTDATADAGKAGWLQVEAARTGRSSCRTCGDPIAKGHARCGMQGRYRGRAEQRWCHAACLLRHGTRASRYKVVRGGMCSATQRPFEKGDIVVRFRIGDAEAAFGLAAAAGCVDMISKLLPSDSLRSATDAWRADDPGIASPGFAQLSLEDRHSVYSTLLSLGGSDPALTPSPPKTTEAVPRGALTSQPTSSSQSAEGETLVTTVIHDRDFQESSHQEGDSTFSAQRQNSSRCAGISDESKRDAEVPNPKRFKRLRPVQPAAGQCLQDAVELE